MIKLSTGLRNNMAGSVGFASAFNKGVIYIYSGAQPLNADSAVSGTLLGKVTVDAGAFSFGTATNGLSFDAPVNGVVSKAAAEDWRFNGIAAGTAGWFRFMGNVSDDLGASTTLARMDGSIGVTGADLNLSNTTIAVSAPNTIDVFSFTIPAQ